MPVSKSSEAPQASPAAPSGRMLVANTNFFADVDGAPTLFEAGVTRVREGHPLLAGREALFDALPEEAHYEVEQATAAPGEKRGR